MVANKSWRCLKPFSFDFPSKSRNKWCITWQKKYWSTSWCIRSRNHCPRPPWLPMYKILYNFWILGVLSAEVPPPLLSMKIRIRTQKNLLPNFLNSRLGPTYYPSLKKHISTFIVFKTVKVENLSIRKNKNILIVIIRWYNLFLQNKKVP